MTSRTPFLLVALATSLLVLSQLAAADQPERKACVVPLSEHGKDLLRKGKPDQQDLRDITELAKGGAVNYKLLDQKSYALIGTDFSTNVLTPTVLDSFTGKEIKDCTASNCGLPKITPIAGAPDFDKQLMLKNAIEAAKKFTQPITINQTVTYPDGTVKQNVPVQYTVIVQAAHPGSVCYTYYTAGKMRQFCYG
ncbi:MAG: hypothetical protein RL563_1252 [Pseudomonadota bacterium]